MALITDYPSYGALRVKCQGNRRNEEKSKEKKWFLVPFYTFLEAKSAVTFAVISYQVVALQLDKLLYIKERRVNKDDGNS
jgi:hypothetical protein